MRHRIGQLQARNGTGRRMRVLTRILAAVLWLTAGLASTAGAQAASTWVVDRDGVQCENADFGSIRDAVRAASAGDLIRVCPDVYEESVEVDKPLTLTGDPDAVEAEDCFSPAASDPARQAIVDGDDASYAFKLEADGVVLEGLVVAGARVGIDATDRFSGYRISHNLVQSNGLHGLDLGSAGTLVSRVDHNCFRLNGLGGIVAELDDDYLDIFDPANRTPANARDLRNARVDHNDTFMNPEAIALVGPGAREHVAVDHNRSRQDQLGISLQNSRDGAIVDNEVSDPRSVAMVIGGGNEGLAIRANRVLGSGGSGIVFVATGFLDRFPVPSTGVVVSENDVRFGRGAGLLVSANTLARSVITANTMTANVANGMSLLAITESEVSANVSSANGGNGIGLGNNTTGTLVSTGNLVRNNEANGNGRHGITVQRGSTGNRFEHNSMHGNGTSNPTTFFDANDGNTPINVWIGNDCVSDFPHGAICGVG